MRRWSIALLSVAALGVLAVFSVGELLSRPVRTAIGPIPPGLAAKPLDLRFGSEGRIAGWFAPGTPGAGAVLLLHGVRSDRRQMVARARFLHARGYAVVLVDLPAHGESAGERITFGLREAEGVKATLAWMQCEWPAEAIGVIGVSLGAASTVLAGPDAQVRAVVLESMYPTIEEAVTDRLRIFLGPWGPPLAPLLLQQIPLRTGIAISALRPIDHVAGIQAPLLIVSGAKDTRTTEQETRRIHEAAQAPKALWIVEGAAHVDLHAFAPQLYEARVGNFLDAHLRSALPAHTAERF